MSTIKTPSFLRKLQEDVKIARRLTLEVEKIALESFDQNFATSSFFGQPWATSNRVKEKGGSVLILTGNLRRDLVGTSTPGFVRIESGGAAPYAKAHNEGFDGTVTQNVRAHRVKQHKRTNKWGKRETVKAHTVNAHSRTVHLKLPKRQFLGAHPQLNAKIEARFLQLMKL